MKYVKPIDVVAVKTAVQANQIAVSVQNGNILMSSACSGECVKIGEYIPDEKPACRWCKQFKGVPLRGFTSHGCESITVRFCPMCGKDLSKGE